MKKTVVILLAFIASFKVVAQDDESAFASQIGDTFSSGSNYIVTHANTSCQVAVHNNGSSVGVGSIARTVYSSTFQLTFAVKSIGTGFNGASGLTTVTILTSITCTGTSSIPRRNSNHSSVSK